MQRRLLAANGCRSQRTLSMVGIEVSPPLVHQVPQLRHSADAGNNTWCGTHDRLTDEQSRAKDLRDRAYTYLADLVSDVREAGRYAYRDEASTRTKFASAYLRRKRKRATNRTANPATPPAPTPGPATDA